MSIMSTYTINNGYTTADYYNKPPLNIFPNEDQGYPDRVTRSHYEDVSRGPLQEGYTIPMPLETDYIPGGSDQWLTRSISPVQSIEYSNSRHYCQSTSQYSEAIKAPTSRGDVDYRGLLLKWEWTTLVSNKRLQESRIAKLRVSAENNYFYASQLVMGLKSMEHDREGPAGEWASGTDELTFIDYKFKRKCAELRVLEAEVREMDGEIRAVTDQLVEFERERSRSSTSVAGYGNTR